MRTASVVAWLCLCASSATAAATGACPKDERAASIATQWSARNVIPPLEVTSWEAARCFQQQFLAALAPELGALVGYKVGLYSQRARTAYRTDQPVLGYLYEKMLIPSGAAVSAAYGAAAAWESDLLLVIADEDINTAKGAQEIYKHLRSYRPFIELTDRVSPPSVPMTATQFEAINVGARMGVVGEDVPLPQTAEAMQRLVNFSVEAITRGAGEKKDSAKALETLGNVLEIAEFARDRLLSEGKRLQAGDLLSVGVITPSRSPAAGQTIEVVYHILPEPTSVSVRFQ
jgi:2-keto-4-pentenoate hydratase